MAAGNKHLEYKDLLNAMEVASPGAKHNFYFGFLDRAASKFEASDSREESTLTRCVRCGSAASGEVCSFCRLVEHTVSVEITSGPDRLSQ